MVKPLAPLRMTEGPPGQELDLSLEGILLLFLGVFALLFGLLLFPIAAGGLPYNPDGTYGLFLVIVALQMITLGKTPFGDLRRSWALVLTGMGAAVLGMAACFIPGLFPRFIRLLVGSVLLFGGISLFLRLCVSDKRGRTWIRTPGILRQLAVACAGVSTVSCLLGAITLFPGLATHRQTAVLLLLYGLGFFHLAWCVRKVARAAPPGMPDDSASVGAPPDQAAPAGTSELFREASLPLSHAILILLGILLTFLGLLLFPVGLGLLPFSPDGQLGLLLTLMALQMLALGDTPLGRQTRSWPVMAVGLAFAGLGVVSCIVPGRLTAVLQALLGLLNILGGLLFFFKRLSQASVRAEAAAQPAPVRDIVRGLDRAQTMINLVAIAFGVFMLFPGAANGFVVAAILVVNGLLLFRLVQCMHGITQRGKDT